MQGSARQHQSPLRRRNCPRGRPRSPAESGMSTRRRSMCKRQGLTHTSTPESPRQAAAMV
eukprot:11796241-Heterocapsa_arctica.AAC.1